MIPNILWRTMPREAYTLTPATITLGQLHGGGVGILIYLYEL
jgi:hypothetical protein